MYSISRMLISIKFWLLRLIAGKSSIVMNVDIDGINGIIIKGETKGSYIYNVKISNLNKGITKEV